VRIHRLYEDAQGESHWEDVEVDYVNVTAGGKTSERLPATGIQFREVAQGHSPDWRPAPRRQYIINLDAPCTLTASDGEVRTIQPGEVLLVEDTTGKGHLSREATDAIRHCIYVTLD
jgi:quercetin dioxygenase-like cupin family protein